ncbi:Nickel-binding periplasmic protein precursor [Sporomusa ovata DSM 2662]|uniref:Oligopeptide ABC transporter, periplasmic oligopeptide-binding protein OppA (TC 3.A.1.5.1) n=1 Tax=Sporomusa ovata TaxID=2378 RepID=A0A0U1KTC9_9FIRM|nr:ABC transporter substrate-binding protein [Sporomusa ovata]EQB24965.1 nickel-binding periplasmic protein [Sporomusa ovata DSM 2662]CQR70163.1 Oligopeptide ABC transporter, periplasmic oligopeptide-binding protein OppA (TC 3.A.1.5.1) [Sporomusa ovata]
MKKWICFFLSIALLLAGMFFTGCGNGKTQAVQQIVIGESTDLGGYDPETNMSYYIRALIFNTLVELDADFKLQPALAERWEMTPDGKTWTFYLRKGVAFHDGTPLTAQIVKQNMDRLRTGMWRSFLPDIADVQATDDLTVVFHLKSPSFIFASDLTVPSYSIVSPTALDVNGKVVKAIGTGPYILEFWQKDQDFVLKRNDNYWGQAPKNEKLVFKVISDPDARAMALEAGMVDFISLRQSLTAAGRLAQNNKLKLEKRLGQTSEMLYFNVNNPVLKDLRVRKAVAHSLNIKEMIPGLLGDSAEPGHAFFSPVFGKYVMPKDVVLPYDLKQAQEYLTAAGWQVGPDGVRMKDRVSLRVRIAFGAKNAEDSLLAGVIQNSLKEVGIIAELVPLEDAALMDALKNKSYDLLMFGQFYIPHNEPSPHYLSGHYHPKAMYGLLTTPEITEAIDQLVITANNKERVALHHKIQGLISEQVPVIVLFHRNNIAAMKKNIMDYENSVGVWQVYRGLEKAYVQ